MMAIIYWTGMIAVYLAGVGTIPVIGWIRWRPPQTLPARPEPSAGDQLQAALHTRTGTHDLDTMDVLTAGWEAGQKLTSGRLPGTEPTRKAGPGDMRGLPEGWRRWEPPPGLHIEPEPTLTPNAAAGVWTPREPHAGYTAAPDLADLATTCGAIAPHTQRSCELAPGHAGTHRAGRIVWDAEPMAYDHPYPAGESW